MGESPGENWWADKMMRTQDVLEDGTAWVS